MASLQELQERRAYACRLTPDRALESVDDAEEFLRDRGMLTRTADSSLPSFFDACHEDPYKPGVAGFATWPATKWPWFWQLAQRPGVYELKIHRGKSILLTEETASFADPVLRSEIERTRSADPRWALLLDHLAAAGPSTAEDLKVELGLKPKELKALRSPLERCGAVVSRTLVVELVGGGHDYVFELAPGTTCSPSRRCTAASTT
jgi:hypothetical protein